MQGLEDNRRKEAIRALINIAAIEGFFLIAVVGVYLHTQNIVHLVGGIAGTALIFGPMIVRWANEHKSALTAKPNSDANAN